jgi:beta-xylosidase
MNRIGRSPSHVRGQALVLAQKHNIFYFGLLCAPVTQNTTQEWEQRGGYPFERLAGLDFRYQPALGFGDDVTRRDPSPVIKADGQFHVWYTLNESSQHGWSGSIWHATSDDGYDWNEQEQAITGGTRPSLDGMGVLTPTICVANDRYYLFYTCAPENWIEDDITELAIGVATADSPNGPWTKNPNNPVLQCSNPPAPDTAVVDATCIVVRDGQYWMYYKAKERGETRFDTTMCLARAEHPEGPWKKYEDNPVIPSGHDVCVWPHGNGVGCLVSHHGKQGNTLQYSTNGVDFWQVGPARPPVAAGPYRPDNFADKPGAGITWGLCIGGLGSDWPFLLRFECDLSASGDD